MHIRVYECLEVHNLVSWDVVAEIDLTLLPSPLNTAVGTPTSTATTLEGSSSLAAISPHLLPSRPGVGNREADGGWCISWCKDKWWGEVLAAGGGQTGGVKVWDVTGICASLFS
jgi:nucleoporin SEH1